LLLEVREGSKPFSPATRAGCTVLLDYLDYIEEEDIRITVAMGARDGPELKRYDRHATDPRLIPASTFKP